MLQTHQNRRESQTPRSNAHFTQGPYSKWSIPSGQKIRVGSVGFTLGPEPKNPVNDMAMASMTLITLVPNSSAVLSVFYTSEKHLIIFFSKLKNGIFLGSLCFFYLTKFCKYFGIYYHFFYNHQIEKINHGLCHERITRIALMICSNFCQSQLSN